jgi:FlaA1/EpsC-like NDP-sugar epimerase
LVRTLIRLSGRNEKQVAIQFTGLREGEKLIEELFYENEEVCATSFPKIKRARGPRQEWSELARHLEELEATLFLNGSANIRAKIRQIVPEYSFIAGNDSAAEAGADSWKVLSGRSIA